MPLCQKKKSIEIMQNTDLSAKVNKITTCWRKQ